jgi:hypothetical protein
MLATRFLFEASGHTIGGLPIALTILRVDGSARGQMAFRED